MSKREIRWLLSKLLPRVSGHKQRLALFTAVLLLAMTGMDYDSVHLHVDPEPIVPTVAVPWAATGNATAQTTGYTWRGSPVSYAPDLEEG